MLSGLGNLLFGSWSAGTETGDNAAVDQTLASQPPPTTTASASALSQNATPLDTRDAESGWVLVDTATEKEATSENFEMDLDESSPRAALVAANPPDQPAGLEMLRGEEEQDVRGEQEENNPNPNPNPNLDQQRNHAVQQRNFNRAARAMRVAEEEVKLAQATQRQQRVSKTKHLTRKGLEMSNLTRSVRKPASANRRALRPSRQMNGRQMNGQRSY